MTPEEYDAWYRSARGSWIGDTEYRLLRTVLAASPGESMLDVGCGTGYFARRFAADGHPVAAIDPDPDMLGYARAHAVGDERYLLADARALPFRDGAFDLCVSVTALCFIPEEYKALGEILRVTRRRFAIGLLNRHSLLYLKRGRRGGSGAYRGARWHTAAELEALFARLPVRDFRLYTAVWLPGGGVIARIVEKALPASLLLGSFLVAAGDVHAA